MKTQRPLEERLRDAYQAAADAWAPSTAPPIRPVTRRPRWRRLAPLAAAVCVITVIAAAVAFGKVHRSARPVDSPSPTATPTGTPTRGLLPARPERPRFAVYAYSEADRAHELRVRDTGSGVVTARLGPPRGDRFEDVAVAGDDRTFIVTTSADRTYSQSSRPGPRPQRISVHRLKLSNDGTIDEFSALPRLSYSTELADLDMAVSPDGARIAFVVYRGHPNKSPVEGTWHNFGRIELVTIATGERRTWSSPYVSAIDDLSWSGSRLGFTFTRLAVPHQGLGMDVVGAMQVRALDTAAPGDDLLAGPVLLSRPSGVVGTDVARLLPDGRSVITNAGHPTRLSLYSTRTGRRIRDLAEGPVAQPDGSGTATRQDWVGLTADTTGRHLLAVPSTGNLVHIDLAGRGTVPMPPGEWRYTEPPAW